MTSLQITSEPDRSKALNADLASADLSGLQILVVDDEPDALEIIALLLKAQGAIVTTVSNAMAALRELERSSFDILISDLGMPKMNGFTLIHQVRTSLHPWRKIPAIALTAFTGQEYQQQALEAGYQWHIPKPLHARDLIAVVHQLTNKQRI